MTNWQKFKIAIRNDPNSFDIILFRLDQFVDFSDGPVNGKDQFITCVDTFPYNTLEVGDYIEIDLDKTRYYKCNHEFNDTSVVRKFGSSAAVVSSSSTGMTIGSTTITREHGLAIARELDSYVEQSGGRNEYTASIEVQDERGRPIKFSISSKRSNYQ